MKQLVLFVSPFLFLFNNFDTPLFSAENQTNISTQQVIEIIGSIALQKVNWDWKTALSEWQIKFSRGRIDELGVADLKEKVIEISVRKGQSPDQVALHIPHEICHAFDSKYMTDKLRREWLIARGFSLSTVWFPCDRCNDYMFGAGDFAESCSWTTQGPGSAFTTKLPQIGPPPNKAQQDLIRRWIIELPKKAKE